MRQIRKIQVRILDFNSSRTEVITVAVSHKAEASSNRAKVEPVSAAHPNRRNLEETLISEAAFKEDVEIIAEVINNFSSKIITVLDLVALRLNLEETIINEEASKIKTKEAEEVVVATEAVKVTTVQTHKIRALAL